MNEPDLLDEPAPPKRRRRRLLWLGLPALVLLTACGGFYAYLLHTAERDLREAEAEADRLDPDGWRLDEIEAHRKVLRDEDNAALVVQAAKAKLRPPWPAPRPGMTPPLADDGAAAPAPPVPTQTVYVETDLDSLPPEVQLDDGLLRDLRASLKPAEPALVEARKLSGLRDGRFPLTYSRDMISTMLNSQDAREAARLMRHEAVLLCDLAFFCGSLNLCTLLYTYPLDGPSVLHKFSETASSIRCAVTTIPSFAAA